MSGRKGLLIIILVLLGSYVLYGRDMSGNNPLETNYLLEDPNESYQFYDNYIYILDSGKKNIVVLNNKKEYLYTINGGERKENFYVAVNLAADSEGNLYVLDRLYEEDGRNLASQRIGTYDNKGKFIGYLYEETDGNKRLVCIKYMEGSLYFAETVNGSIRINKLSSSGDVTSCMESPLPCPAADILDLDIGQDLALVYATVDGQVYQSDNTGKIQSINYGKDPGPEDEYPYMVPREVAFDSLGRIYINDTGRKIVVRLDERSGGEEIAVAMGEGLEAITSESFAEQPIYSGLNLNHEDELSLIVNEYTYDANADAYIYYYTVYTKDSQGEITFQGYQFDKSVSFRVKEWSWYIALLLLMVGAAYMVVWIIQLCREIKMEQSVKIQAAVLLSSIVVTIFVAFFIIQYSNERYIQEVIQKMGNISKLITVQLTEAEIEKIQKPTDYKTATYASLDEKVWDVLHNEDNKDAAIYCVIYKVIDNMLYTAYADEMTTACGNLMAGVFEGSIEENVIHTGESYVSYAYQSAEGSYMFVLSPIYDSEGNPLGLIEVGMDLYAFTKSNESMFYNILLYMFVILIMCMLIFSEVLVFYEAHAKTRAMKKQGSKKIDPAMIRMGTFFICFIANMSTAFLPVYGKELWNDSLGISMEYASALPLSVELCFSSAASFVGGYLLYTFGTKKLGIAGAVFYGISNLGCFLTGTFWIFIIWNGISGIGGGIFSTAVSTYLMKYDETQKNRGFAHFNAAFLSGMNCGTVAGSLLADNLGYAAVFGIGALFSIIAVFFILIGMKTEKGEKCQKKRESGSISALVFLKDREVLKYFICICIPYLVCGSFLNYFFPIFGEAENLSTTQVSMAFLLSGLISIYLGPMITEIVSKKISKKKAVALSAFLFVMAFGIFILNPSLESCILAIGLLAVADSFGLTAQSVYYTSLPQVYRFGEGKAIGVSSLFENLASAAGPLIFASALMLGTQKGLLVILIICCLLFGGFVVGDKYFVKFGGKMPGKDD